MPEDLISGQAAAKLIGVTHVCIHYWRDKGTGPTAYPIHKTKITHYRYSKAEVLTFARGRMDPAERIAALESTVDRLVSRLDPSP